MLAGTFDQSGSSSSESSESEVRSFPCVAFRVVEQRAFTMLQPSVQRSLGPLPLPIVLPALSLIRLQTRTWL